MLMTKRGLFSLIISQIKLALGLSICSHFYQYGQGVEAQASATADSNLPRAERRQSAYAKRTAENPFSSACRLATWFPKRMCHAGNGYVHYKGQDAVISMAIIGLQSVGYCYLTTQGVCGGVNRVGGPSGEAKSPSCELTPRRGFRPIISTFSPLASAQTGN